MDESHKRSKASHSWRREHEELKLRKIHKLEKRLNLDKENGKKKDDDTLSSPSDLYLTPDSHIHDNESRDGDFESPGKEVYEEVFLTPSPEFDDCTVDEETSPEKNAALEAQEKDTLYGFINEITEKFNKMTEIRNTNLQLLGNKREDTSTIKLDSNVKKNTSFIKKVRHFTASQFEQLMKEMKTLNLSKYISEFASAIVECKLKMSDIDPAVQLCVAVFQRYCDFSTHLLENWQKTLTIKKDDKNVNHSKLRVDIRFYCELINNGIFTHKESLPLLGNVLTCLINNDKEEHHNMAIILSFCKHCGFEYAGLIPKTIINLAEKYNEEIQPLHFLPKDKQKNVKVLLKDYYQSLTRHLIKEHNELCIIKKQNKKILQTKGELSAERKSKLDQMVLSYQRLFTNTETFAEYLNEDLPDLSFDDESTNECCISKSEDYYACSKADDLWEDEDSKHFYEDLLDLKDYIPGIIGIKHENHDDDHDVINEDELDPDLIEELVVIDERCVENDIDEDSEKSTNASNKQLWENFSNDLPNAVSRITIDSMVVDFILNLNTKQNRKKLTKLLFNVPRIRLDLLPLYARFVATINPLQPDIGNDLCNLLKNDFKFHIKKKDQMNIESKVKVVRFIGELVKFNIYPKSDVLFCIKTLLNDFEHHHIEMCTNLIESCGLYLYRNPSTSQRMDIYLELMMRKKSVLALDSRHVTMIENAYFFVLPPIVQKKEIRDEPAIFSYIRNSIFYDLNKINSNDIFNFIMQLDLNEPTVQDCLVECLTKAYKVKYYNIKYLAGLTTVIALHYETIGIMVVDNVFEDIKLGLEINHPKHNQRRIAMIRYIGELYNYRMLDTNDLITLLYTLITFGVNLNYDNPSTYDPPDNLFRVRLVCFLLETSGRYFSHSSSLKKLLYFLVFFQHYYLFKYTDPVWCLENPFPVTIEYLFQDTLKSIDPKIKFYESLEEAQIEVFELHKKFSDNFKTFNKLNDSLSSTDSFEVPAEPSEINSMIENIGKGNIELERVRVPGELGELGTIQDTDEEESKEEEIENKEDFEEGVIEIIEVQVEKKNKRANSRRNSENNEINEQPEIQMEEKINHEKLNRHDDLLLAFKKMILDTDGHEENHEMILDNLEEEMIGVIDREEGEEENEDEEDEDEDEEPEDVCNDNSLVDDEDEEEASFNYEENIDNIPSEENSQSQSDQLPSLIGPSLVNCSEDDEFQLAFERMVIDNYHERIKEHVKPQCTDISVPLHIRTNSKKTYEQLKESSSEEKSTINFTLMLRKGHKKQYKNLAVPISSDLAMNLKNKEEAERAEKEKFKKLTLDINERLEEEDYQEMLNQNRPVVMNLNRERRIKYQHPKGAPDADLIFGKKLK